jgi:hypothetical protein
LETPHQKVEPSELIERALEKLGEKLFKGELKGTMGDLIRLLQLQKDLGFDQPTQVTVQWVDKSGE